MLLTSTSTVVVVDKCAKILANLIATNATVLDYIEREIPGE